VSAEEDDYARWWKAQKFAELRAPIEAALEDVLTRRGLEKTSPGTWTHRESEKTFRVRKIVRWLAPLWQTDREAALRKLEGELVYQLEHPEVRRRTAG
jgi:hypothetical protein